MDLYLNSKNVPIYSIFEVLFKYYIQIMQVREKLFAAEVKYCFIDAKYGA